MRFVLRFGAPIAVATARAFSGRRHCAREVGELLGGLVPAPTPRLGFCMVRRGHVVELEAPTVVS